MIKKTILFFMLIIALVLAGDRLFGWILEKLYSNKYKGMSGGDINYYLSYNQIDLLAVGSSRSRKHMVPDSISIPSFNLSHNGMGIGFQAALIDILKERKRLPAKLLLLQIEPYALFAKDSSINNDIQYLKYYYTRNDYVKQNIDKIDKFEFVKQWFHSYKFNGTLPSIVKNSLESARITYINGNKGFEESEPSSMDSLNTTLSYQIFLKNYKNIPCTDWTPGPGFDHLKHIAAICKTAGITLVCYTSPYYKDARINEYASRAKVLLQRENIEYINFSQQVYPELASPFLWKDWTHLNTQGARIFSGMLNDSLVGRKLINPEVVIK